MIVKFSRLSYISPTSLFISYAYISRDHFIKFFIFVESLFFSIFLFLIYTVFLIDSVNIALLVLEKMLSENAVNKKNSYKYGTNSEYLKNYLKFSKMQCHDFSALLQFPPRVLCLRYINGDRYKLHSSEENADIESFTSNLGCGHTNEKVVYFFQFNPKLQTCIRFIHVR